MGCFSAFLLAGLSLAGLGFAYGVLGGFGVFLLTGVFFYAFQESLVRSFVASDAEKEGRKEIEDLHRFLRLRREVHRVLLDEDVPHEEAEAILESLEAREAEVLGPLEEKYQLEAGPRRLPPLLAAWIQRLVAEGKIPDAVGDRLLGGDDEARALPLPPAAPPEIERPAPSVPGARWNIPRTRPAGPGRSPTTPRVVPGEPVEAEAPVELEVPVEPEVPVEAEPPLQLEVPVEAELPVEAKLPVEPELPVEAEPPVEPEVPVEAELPVEPEVPVEAELPVEPEVPVEAEPPVEPEVPVEAEAPVEPEVPVEAEPPVEPDSVDPPPVPEVLVPPPMAATLAMSPASPFPYDEADARVEGEAIPPEPGLFDRLMAQFIDEGQVRWGELLFALFSILAALTGVISIAYYWGDLPSTLRYGLLVVLAAASTLLARGIRHLGNVEETARTVAVISHLLAPIALGSLHLFARGEVSLPGFLLALGLGGVVLGLALRPISSLALGSASPGYLPLFVLAGALGAVNPRLFAAAPLPGLVLVALLMAALSYLGSRSVGDAAAEWSGARLLRLGLPVYLLLLGSGVAAATLTLPLGAWTFTASMVGYLLWVAAIEEGAGGASFPGVPVALQVAGFAVMGIALLVAVLDEPAFWWNSWLLATLCPPFFASSVAAVREGGPRPAFVSVVLMTALAVLAAGPVYGLTSTLLLLPAAASALGAMLLESRGPEAARAYGRGAHGLLLYVFGQGILHPLEGLASSLMVLAVTFPLMLRWRSRRLAFWSTLASLTAVLFGTFGLWILPARAASGLAPLGALGGGLAAACCLALLSGVVGLIHGRYGEWIDQRLPRPEPPCWEGDRHPVGFFRVPLGLLAAPGLVSAFVLGCGWTGVAPDLLPGAPGIPGPLAFALSTAFLALAGLLRAEDETSRAAHLAASGACLAVGLAGVWLAGPAGAALGLALGAIAIVEHGIAQGGGGPPPRRDGRGILAFYFERAHPAAALASMLAFAGCLVIPDLLGAPSVAASAAPALASLLFLWVGFRLHRLLPFSLHLHLAPVFALYAGVSLAAGSSRLFQAGLLAVGGALLAALGRSSRWQAFVSDESRAGGGPASHGYRPLVDLPLVYGLLALVFAGSELVETAWSTLTTVATGFVPALGGMVPGQLGAGIGVLLGIGALGVLVAPGYPGLARLGTLGGGLFGIASGHLVAALLLTRGQGRGAVCGAVLAGALLEALAARVPRERLPDGPEHLRGGSLVLGSLALLAALGYLVTADSVAAFYQGLERSPLGAELAVSLGILALSGWFRAREGGGAARHQLASGLAVTTGLAGAFLLGAPGAGVGLGLGALVMIERGLGGRAGVVGGAGAAFRFDALAVAPMINAAAYLFGLVLPDLWGSFRPLGLGLPGVLAAFGFLLAGYRYNRLVPFAWHLHLSPLLVLYVVAGSSRELPEVSRGGLMALGGVVLALAGLTRRWEGFRERESEAGGGPASLGWRPLADVPLLAGLMALVLGSGAVLRVVQGALGDLHYGLAVALHPALPFSPATSGVWMLLALGVILMAAAQHYESFVPLGHLGGVGLALGAAHLVDALVWPGSFRPVSAVLSAGAVALLLEGLAHQLPRHFRNLTAALQTGGQVLVGLVLLSAVHLAIARGSFPHLYASVERRWMGGALTGAFLLSSLAGWFRAYRGSRAGGHQLASGLACTAGLAGAWAWGVSGAATLLGGASVVMARHAGRGAGGRVGGEEGSTLGLPLPAAALTSAAGFALFVMVPDLLGSVPGLLLGPSFGAALFMISGALLNRAAPFALHLHSTPALMAYCLLSLTGPLTWVQRGAVLALAAALLAAVGLMDRWGALRIAETRAGGGPAADGWRPLADVPLAMVSLALVLGARATLGLTAGTLQDIVTGLVATAHGVAGLDPWTSAVWILLGAGATFVMAAGLYPRLQPLGFAGGGMVGLGICHLIDALVWPGSLRPLGALLSASLAAAALEGAAWVMPVARLRFGRAHLRFGARLFLPLAGLAAAVFLCQGAPLSVLYHLLDQSWRGAVAALAASTLALSAGFRAAQGRPSGEHQLASGLVVAAGLAGAWVHGPGGAALGLALGSLLMAERGARTRGVEAGPRPPLSRPLPAASLVAGLGFLVLVVVPDLFGAFEAAAAVPASLAAALFGLAGYRLNRAAPFALHLHASPLLFLYGLLTLSRSWAAVPQATLIGAAAVLLGAVGLAPSWQAFVEREAAGGGGPASRGFRPLADVSLLIAGLVAWKAGPAMAGVVASTHGLVAGGLVGPLLAGTRDLSLASGLWPLLAFGGIALQVAIRYPGGVLLGYPGGILVGLGLCHLVDVLCWGSSGLLGGALLSACFSGSLLEFLASRLPQERCPHTPGHLRAGAFWLYGLVGVSALWMLVDLRSFPAFYEALRGNLRGGALAASLGLLAFGGWWRRNQGASWGGHQLGAGLAVASGIAGACLGGEIGAATGFALAAAAAAEFGAARSGYRIGGPEGAGLGGSVPVTVGVAALLVVGTVLVPDLASQALPVEILGALLALVWAGFRLGRVAPFAGHLHTGPLLLLHGAWIWSRTLEPAPRTGAGLAVVAALLALLGASRRWDDFRQRESAAGGGPASWGFLPLVDVPLLGSLIAGYYSWGAMLRSATGTLLEGNLRSTRAVAGWTPAAEGIVPLLGIGVVLLVVSARSPRWRFGQGFLGALGIALSLCHVGFLQWPFAMPGVGRLVAAAVVGWALYLVAPRTSSERLPGIPTRLRFGASVSVLIACLSSLATLPGMLDPFLSGLGGVLSVAVLLGYGLPCALSWALARWDSRGFFVWPHGALLVVTAHLAARMIGLVLGYPNPVLVAGYFAMLLALTGLLLGIVARRSATPSMRLHLGFLLPVMGLVGGLFHLWTWGQEGVAGMLSISLPLLLPGVVPLAGLTLVFQLASAVSGRAWQTTLAVLTLATGSSVLLATLVSLRFPISSGAAPVLAASVLGLVLATRCLQILGARWATWGDTPPALFRFHRLEVVEFQAGALGLLATMGILVLYLPTSFEHLGLVLGGGPLFPPGWASVSFHLLGFLSLVGMYRGERDRAWACLGGVGFLLLLEHLFRALAPAMAHASHALGAYGALTGSVLLTLGEAHLAREGGPERNSATGLRWASLLGVGLVLLQVRASLDFPALDIWVGLAAAAPALASLLVFRQAVRRNSEALTWGGEAVAAATFAYLKESGILGGSLYGQIGLQVAAFALLGVAQKVRGGSMEVLARPFRRTALVLPALALLNSTFEPFRAIDWKGFDGWGQFSIAVMAAAFYGIVGQLEGRALLRYLGAVCAYAGLTLLFHGHLGFDDPWRHLDFYVVPLGLLIVFFSVVEAKNLLEEQQRTMRTVGLLFVYISPALHSVWNATAVETIVLMLLGLVGIALGVLLRIRLYQLYGAVALATGVGSYLLNIYQMQQVNFAFLTFSALAAFFGVYSYWARRRRQEMGI